MNALSHYRALATDRMAHHYKVEEQCLTCLEVLSRKADDPSLRQTIALFATDSRVLMNTLQRLLSSLDVPAEAGSTVGINGILQEGFQRLEHEPEAARRDAIILQTIILLHQYRVGNYYTILRYFRTLNWNYEAHLLRGLLTDAEATLARFTELLTAVSGGAASSAQPQPMKEPVYA